MSRNIRRDESALNDVLKLVEALLKLSQEQANLTCDSKLELWVVWETADKLRITGYKDEQTKGKKNKITEVGTTKQCLLKQIKNPDKTLEIPPQTAEPNVSQEISPQTAEANKQNKKELDKLQNALDFLKELGVREDQKSTKSQGYWKFTLTLKHQTATIKDNLEVVEQKWDECQKANSKETFQEQTTDNSLDWQEICGAMLEKHKRLTTNELLFADDEMKFELKDIHVPLALVERSKPKKCSEDISAEQGSRLYEPSYEEKQRFEHEAFLEQVIRDGVGKTQGHRIALIGEPGAGKTTQLQTIAFWILNNNLGLPIWISLADLQGKSVKDYLLENWLEDALEPVEDTTEEEKKALADLFKNNSVWLLLDAADEMSLPQPLTKIYDQLTGWVKHARVVLTCRVNVWEANGGALENFETYRLLNFEYPQQVQEFIGRWFQPRNLTPQPPLLIKERGSNKGERLWQELDKPEHQRIQDLVKNPLRLALLCSTWQRSDKGLPETKAGLYQQFVEEVYKWKENRFPTTEQQQEELNAALGRLANRAIHQETSRFRLRHKFVREVLGDAKQQNSLFWLALKLGWLNEVGVAAESETKEKVYAFYHPTFEEYFAALAIDDWHEFLNHVPDNPAQGIYRIFAPQWKEVILLWLGRDDVEREKKEEFIQALVDFKDGCGEWNTKELVDKGFYEYRAYFLAAAGIAEFRGYPGADEIVAQIVKWDFGYFNTKKEKWVQFSSTIQYEVRSALQQTERTQAIKELEILLQSEHVDEYTRIWAALCLGKINPRNKNAIAYLEKLLQSTTVDDDTRLEIAESLEEIGMEDDEFAIAAWDEQMQSEIRKDYIEKAAYSLGTIDPGNEKAITALVKLLRSTDVDEYTCENAAESLEEIGINDEFAIAALVELLEPTTVDDYTRRQAAYILGTIAISNKTAITALEELLKPTTVDDHTRMQAAYSLGKIDPGNEKAIAELVKLLQSTDVDGDTLRRPAYYLGEIGGNQDAIVIPALEKLLQSTTAEHHIRRMWAAYSLGTINPGNQDAIAALVELLQLETVDDKTRRWAASNLGKIGKSDQKAITALEKLLQSTTVDHCIDAAESLEKINPGNQKAIAALEKLLQSTTVDDFTRQSVAESLGTIDPGNEKAIAALVELLESKTVDNKTRIWAAESLGKIGKGDEKAIAALVELVQSKTVDYATKSAASESFGKVLQDNKHWSLAVRSLKDYLQIHHNYDVIWKCAQSMRYPAFYQAWHQQEKVKDGE
jgi:predicted NACHT family NTPase